MKTGAFHLTYCLNIHPGDAWWENFAAIRKYALPIKQRVCPDRPFGLGLRLSNEASLTLERPGVCREVRDFLTDYGLYVFSVNGFPYGRFHENVKKTVYAPDWRTPERLEYTVRLAEVLAGLLPDGVSGSISTVPGGYGRLDERPIRAGLEACARRLAEIRAETGKDIRLGLEPEPGCFLSTADEAIRFIKSFDSPHLGICFDTCHEAVQFGDPAEALRKMVASGIRLSKVQLSAALAARGTGPEVADALAPFAEPVYLHQTCAEGGGEWPDLPQALPELRKRTGRIEARVHFHVPLHFSGRGILSSTAGLLDAGFFRSLAKSTEHVEIETYSLAAMPGGAGDVVDSVSREFEWVLERTKKAG